MLGGAIETKPLLPMFAPFIIHILIMTDGFLRTTMGALEMLGIGYPFDCHDAVPPILARYSARIEGDDFASIL